MSNACKLKLSTFSVKISSSFPSLWKT